MLGHIRQPQMDKYIVHEKTLFEMLPKQQLARVFSQDRCDIDTTFLGFTDIYRHLSEIIPLQFTIVDLGCAYAPQCFYFEKHKKYIGVDNDASERFKAYNTEHWHCTTGQFVERALKDLQLNQTFAICSYVPPWNMEDSMKIVRDNFIHVFTYYPQRW